MDPYQEERLESLSSSLYYEDNTPSKQRACLPNVPMFSPNTQCASLTWEQKATDTQIKQDCLETELKLARLKLQSLEFKKRYSEDQHLQGAMPLLDHSHTYQMDNQIAVQQCDVRLKESRLKELEAKSALMPCLSHRISPFLSTLDYASVLTASFTNQTPSTTNIEGLLHTTSSLIYDQPDNHRTCLSSNASLSSPHGLRLTNCF